MTPRKTSVVLEKIPAELCTADEAREILGMKSHINIKKARYKHLRYSYVIHNGYQKVLYNRAEIEALKYPAGPPEGWVDIKEAARILGLEDRKTAQELALHMLKIYGVKEKEYHSQQNYRAHFIYRREEVESVAKLRKELQ